MKNLLIFVCVFISSHALAASFDCSKASSDIEKAICTDQELSNLDDQLAKIYKEALNSSQNKDLIKQSQRDWIRTDRNSSKNKEALKIAYQDRINELSKTNGKSTLQKTIQERLEEANKFFTYDGKPLNPHAVQQLAGNENFTPIAMEIYSDSYATGDYVANKVDDGIFHSVDWTENGYQFYRGYFHYGMLDNGIHVVEVSESTGGTMVAKNLVLCKFIADSVYDENGHKKERLTLMSVGNIVLGDRYAGKITLKGNEIHIASNENELQQSGLSASRVLKFE